MILLLGRTQGDTHQLGPASPRRLRGSSSRCSARAACGEMKSEEPGGRQSPTSDTETHELAEIASRCTRRRLSARLFASTGPKTARGA